MTLIFIHQAVARLRGLRGDERMLESFNTMVRWIRVEGMSHLVHLVHLARFTSGKKNFDSLRAAMMLIFTQIELHIEKIRIVVLIFFEITTIEA
jgi:hypothetical protein